MSTLSDNLDLQKLLRMNCQEISQYEICKNSIRWIFPDFLDIWRYQSINFKKFHHDNKRRSTCQK